MDFTEGMYVTTDSRIDELKVENARLNNENAVLKAERDGFLQDLGDMNRRLAQIGQIAR